MTSYGDGEKSDSVISPALLVMTSHVTIIVIIVNIVIVIIIIIISFFLSFSVCSFFSFFLSLFGSVYPFLILSCYSSSSSS